MTNSPDPMLRLNQQQIHSSWQQFIKHTISPIDCQWSNFPKSQIIKFATSPRAPKIKQLMHTMCAVYRKYQRNCEYFRQLILLFYLLIVKGCGNSQQLIDMSLNVLQQLLTYRLVVVCSASKSTIIAQVYSYMDNWLRVLVPTVFSVCQMNSVKQKQPIKEKTFLSILFNINKNQDDDSESTERQSRFGCESIENQLLVIFQCLLVSKIRCYLNHSSLFQFDNIMRRVYSVDKFWAIYNGRGCITHIQNKDKQKRQYQRETNNSKVIQISMLVPIRSQQSDWRVDDLQLISNNYQQEQNIQQINKNYLKFGKVMSYLPMQQWIVESFNPKTAPTPIKLNIHQFLTKMKAIEMYNFMSLLEIYGSNPNIQVLNDYILDEKLLQFFTNFLLGQNLIQVSNKIYFKIDQNREEEEQEQNKNKKLQYNYKNSKFNEILQRCMNQATKLQAQSEKNLLIQQFKTKLLCNNYDSQIQQKPNSNQFIFSESSNIKTNDLFKR